MIKRCLAIHDISCVGKCSLTVALPIISAMGNECAVLPTAVLSTHTAGFKGYTFRDLTDEMPKIEEHWVREGLKFDSIYTGYLGSFEQLKYVGDIIDSFPGAKVIIDPVMGDNGKLYTGFTEEFAAAMAKLCAKADVILPNFTEAAYMLGDMSVLEANDEQSVKAVIMRLAALGAKNVVLTGVHYDDKHLGVAAYNGETGEITTYFRDKIDVSMHGTGDVYASTFTGAYMKGRSLEQAARAATDFTVLCIEKTMPDIKEHWYSVEFEAAMHELVNI
ncbi:MAG: pyridoxamine kinase [Clostridia bacterium]|nr:pyridoxamine kinase [Clostridia bacterium]